MKGCFGRFTVQAASVPARTRIGRFQARTSPRAPSPKPTSPIVVQASVTAGIPRRLALSALSHSCPSGMGVGCWRTRPDVPRSWEASRARHILSGNPRYLKDLQGQRTPFADVGRGQPTNRVLHLPLPLPRLVLSLAWVESYAAGFIEATDTIYGISHYARSEI